MSEWDELLKELDSVADLAKAMPKTDGKGAKGGDGGRCGGGGDGGKPEEAEDDENIRAAAEAGDDPDDEGAMGGEDDEDDEMAKALGVGMITIERDGKQERAYDGMALLKALHGKVVGGEVSMLKALGSVAGSMRGLQQRLVEQGDMLKSMREQLDSFGAQGRGRKAVLSVTDKPDLGADLRKGGEMTGRDVLAKALKAQGQGRLTGLDVSVIEGYVARGQLPPTPLLSQLD